MGKGKKKFDVRKLRLPVYPGDKIYYVHGDDSIEPETVTAVGFDEDGKLMVMCDRAEYEIGNEEGVFLSEEDARLFIQNPDLIPEDYGRVDYKSMDLPYYPGTTFYYCEDDTMSGWEIFVEEYNIVYFGGDGSIRVGDGCSECVVVGDHVDPCFCTLQEAQNYIRAQKKGM